MPEGLHEPPHPSCCIIASMSTTPQCSATKAVVVEPHDVDQLHVDALAGPGHAHQLTLVSSRRPHTRDDLVTAGQNVLGVHPQIGKRGTIHAKELQDTLLGRRETGSLLVLDEAVCEQSAEPVDVSGIEQVIRRRCVAEWSIVVPFVGSADPTPNTNSTRTDRPAPLAFDTTARARPSASGGGQPSHLESLSGFEGTAGV